MSNLEFAKRPYWVLSNAKTIASPILSLREYFNQRTYDLPVKSFLTKFLNGKIGRFVDVGCGLFPDTYWPNLDNVTLVDWGEKIASPSDKKIFADAGQLPFSKNTFLISLSKQVMNYVVDQEALITEMSRVTKVDGYVIIIGIEGIFESNASVSEFNIEDIRGQMARHNIKPEETQTFYNLPNYEYAPGRFVNAKLTGVVGRKIKKKH